MLLLGLKHTANIFGLLHLFLERIHFFDAGYIFFNQVLAGFFNVPQTAFKRFDAFTQAGADFRKFFAAENQEGNTKYY